MRNAKLWSVLLAAVLLCACVVGMMFTGVGATDSRIPTATTTYVVGADGDTIRACLEKAATQSWGKDDVLEIRFSGEDKSIYTKADAENGISGYTMFEVTTIFREDDTKLPIVIRGTAADRAAKIAPSENTYHATNDYHFTDLTFGGTSKFFIYAGCGELVFENTTHANIINSYYYGDNHIADTFEGWTKKEFDANKDPETGLLKTGMIFGNGCDGLFADGASGVHFTAVGGNLDKTNTVLASYKRTASKVSAALTEDQVKEIREAAPEVTYPAGNVVSEAVVKPWDTSAHMIMDCGRVADITAKMPDYTQCSARTGISPVQEATVEILSGGTVYLSAESASGTSETFVGNTKVVFAGGRSGHKTTNSSGKALYGDCGIRLCNYAMYVGNLTLEVREDDPAMPTFTPWIQVSQSGATSTVFGDYHFLMTGGTVGLGTSSNDGYWGVPFTTGSCVNEVTGGKLWAFYGTRHGQPHENTTVSTILPGTNEPLTVKVAVHNKISGGEIGGLVSGALASNKGFFGQTKSSYNSTTKAFTNAAPASVCNEITGGTLFQFNAANSNTTQVPGEIYNFISGTTEKYPHFLTHFFGTNCTVTTPAITNVFKGYAKYQNLAEEKLSIYGGCKNGTVDSITNYLGGMPLFDDFYGGVAGAAPASGKTDADCEGVAGHITNTIALDMTTSNISNNVWGGNGYHSIKGVDGWTADSKGNSQNVVTGSITTSIYSGHFGTIRGDSAVGKTDNVPLTVNVYGGTWTSAFVPLARIVANTSTAAKDSDLTVNVYGGTFNGIAYMGAQNSNNRDVVNNVYGGTFNGNYYGGGKNWAKTVTNNIYGGTFNAYFCGAGTDCDAESVTNNIYGGIFNSNYYGGSAGSSTFSFTCPTIVNNFYGGEGCSKGNTHIYLGNGSPTFTGKVQNTFYAADSEHPGWDSKRSYIYAGSAISHVNTEAEYTIETTINGGTFTGFWGSSGGKTSVIEGNVKTVVNGGTFNPYDNNTLKNSIAAATRNGTMTGDALLEINGGTFNGITVAGVIYGADADTADIFNGNIVLNINGGIFNEGIYKVNKPGQNVALAEGKTCTVNVNQTASKALYFGDDAEIDSFIANGEAVEIGKNTDVEIASLTGKLTVHQTEGWLAHDYLKLPANSQCEILESPEIFGSYTADDTILVKGDAISAKGATLRLGERLGVRILLNKADVDAYGEAFTYTVKLGDTKIAEGGYAEIVENNYSILFDGIGLSQFGEKFTVDSSTMADIEYSIADLAAIAKDNWTDADWKAYAEALLEFHNVYNLDAQNTKTPDAVAFIPVATRGNAGVVSAKATLLMSDAAGLRLTVTLEAAPVNAKFVVGSKEIAATVDGNTISAEFFFAHEYLAESFTVSVQSDAGEHMTYTASIEALAAQLMNQQGNENADNAQAFLYYAQKAVACK